MPPTVTRRYLLYGLENQPAVLSQLLRDLGPDDPAWDRRPDPERFTLREIVAHLADFEPIWLERVERTAGEVNPVLPSADEGQMAIDHDYASTDPFESLQRYRRGRAALVARLRDLPDDGWDRAGRREQIGPMTIFEQMVMVLSHDGYHTGQVTEWLGAI